MTTDTRHIEAAGAIVVDPKFGLWMTVGRVGKCADIIAAALAAAHADGMRRAAEIARCDCCDVCGESPGYPKCANEIAAAILAEAGEREG